MSISVSIADDHPMILTGLRHILAEDPDIKVLETYLSGSSLLEGLRHVQPDVLLLDIHFPDSTGDKLVKEVLKIYPSIRIIALTNLESPFYIYHMVKEGVSGYLSKNSGADHILEAIKKVFAGEHYIQDEMREKMEVFSKKMKSRDVPKISLTQREKDVLRLAMQGHTLKETSETLFLGQRTIEYYRTNLFMKFDVRNLAELIRKAVEIGYPYEE